MFTVRKSAGFVLNYKEYFEDGSGITKAGNDANRWPFTKVPSNRLGHIGESGSVRRVLDDMTLSGQTAFGFYLNFQRVMSGR